MNISLKILEPTLDLIRADLARPHSFAKERVGFLYCRYAGPFLVGIDYQPVLEDGYEHTEEPISLINESAIRSVMERVYKTKEVVFHVHEHANSGRPELSKFDLIEIPKLLMSFNAVAPGSHGVLLLSSNRARVWCIRSGDLTGATLTIVGFPTRKEKA